MTSRPMMAYYNEFDKKKCAMLSQLMKDGLIMKGDIDDRSIADVRAADLKGYARCHFFAGIGLWDYALDLSDWEEDRPVWTGSCPCQPFSSAGRQKGKADDRHLWPAWFNLIKELRPATIFGEQVASAVNMGVSRESVFSVSDRESERYVQAVQRAVEGRATSSLQELSKRVREEMAEYVKGEQEKVAAKEEGKRQAIQAKMDSGKQGEIFSFSGQEKRKEEEPSFRPRCSCCGNTITDRCWNMRGEQIPLGYWGAGRESVQHAEYRPNRAEKRLCLLEHKDSVFCNQCRLWRLGAGEYEESYEQLVRRFLNEQPRLADEVRYKPDEPITHGWLDDVYQGLEIEGYAVGAAVLPACGVGAPHRRDRLWFVANSESERIYRTGGTGCEKIGRQERDDCLLTYGASEEFLPESPLGDAEGEQNFRAGSSRFQPISSQSSEGSLGAASSPGLQGHGGTREESCAKRREIKERHHWEAGVWLSTPDGTSRLVEPSIPLLVNGDTERVGLIHASGDAIVPQVAATWIRAYREALR